VNPDALRLSREFQNVASALSLSFRLPERGANQAKTQGVVALS